MTRCKFCYQMTKQTLYKIFMFGESTGITVHLIEKCDSCRGWRHLPKLMPHEMDKLPVIYSKNYIKKFGDPRIVNQRGLF